MPKSLKNPTCKKVSAEELGAWLKRDHSKQALVADRLYVSIATLRGWWSGRTIPDQYHHTLRNMMNGQETLILDLHQDVLKKLQSKAKAKNFPHARDYLMELITKFIIT